MWPGSPRPTFARYAGDAKPRIDSGDGDELSFQFTNSVIPTKLRIGSANPKRVEEPAVSLRQVDRMQTNRVAFGGLTTGPSTALVRSPRSRINSARDDRVKLHNYPISKFPNYSICFTPPHKNPQTDRG